MTKRSPRRRSTFALLLSALSFAAVASPPLHAGGNRWTPIGPPGGYVRVLAAAPGREGTAYASLDNRLFRTDDAGASWRELPPLAAQTFVFDVIVDPRGADTVYLTGSSGILKSSDGGRSWAASTLPGSTGALALAAAAPDTLYAVGNGIPTSEIYKSVDGGASWLRVTPLVAGAPLISAQTLSVDPRDARSVYAGGYLHPGGDFAAGLGVIHSSDGGATWTVVPGLANSLLQVSFDPAIRTTLYATGGGVFRSVDGGATWRDVSPEHSLAIIHFAVDPAAPATIYALGLVFGYQLWRTDDRGDHWTALTTEDSVFGAFALDPRKPARLYFGASESGVARSEDGGATWAPAGRVLAASPGTVAIDPRQPATLYAGGNGGGAVRSVDAGAHWQVVNDGLIVSRVFPTDPPIWEVSPTFIVRFLPDPLTAGTVHAASDAGIFRSVDGGTSWSGPFGADRLVDLADLEVDPLHPGTLYAAGLVAFDSPAGSCGVAVNRGGLSWTDLTCSAPRGFDVAAVGVDPATARVLAVVRQPFALLASDDGATLHPFGSGLPALAADQTVRRSRLRFDPTSAGTVFLSIDTSPGGIFRSTDSGAHWSAAANGLPAGTVTSDLLLDPRTAGTLYAATDRGVFVSTDRAGTWAPLTDGLTRPVVALAADPSGTTLVAASEGAGLFAFHRGACTDSDTALCVQRERFRVEVSWQTPDGASGAGHALPFGAGAAASAAGPDSAGFWFFTPNNVDLVVKVLDGSAIGGHFWVFYGALSNVAYTLTVTDTATGAQKVYRNPQGHLASHADTGAFPATAVRSPLPAASPALAPAAAVPRQVRPAADTTAGCDPAVALCLGGGRFRAEVAWRDPSGNTGTGHPLALTDDTGSFWFFDPANVELILKVLDGNAIDGHFWVFFGALSDVEYTVTVTDTATGRQRVYTNPHGTLASVADVTAF